MTILNRVVKWTRQEIEYCIDQRHSHKPSQGLCIETSMEVTSPITREIQNLRDDEKQTDEDETTEHEHDSDQDDGQGSRAMQRAYRAAAAKCNHIGMGQTSIQNANKEAEWHHL